MYSWEVLLDLKNEKYVVSMFYVGRAQLFSSLLLFWSICPQGTTPVAQPGTHLSPASVCVLNKSCYLNKHKKVI